MQNCKLIKKYKSTGVPALCCVELLICKQNNADDSIKAVAGVAHDVVTRRCQSLALILKVNAS